MPEKKYYWLKLHKDFFKQKEIKRLRRIAGGDVYTIIYLKMLLQSLETNGFLYYDGYYDNFVDELAADIDEDEENVRVVVGYLIEKGLMEEKDEDSYLLTKCGEMTGSESASAHRVRKHRALQCNGTALLCNSDVTNCNTEKEKEKEKEIEKDEKKQPASRFQPPSLDEVKAYCIERKNNVDAERFVDYYQSNGWKVGGRSKMKDWKAAVRNWERSGYNNNSKGGNIIDQYGKLNFNNKWFDESDPTVF